ncbi:MAG: STAS domain-containing protein [Acidimicrobiales bacterium]
MTELVRRRSEARGPVVVVTLSGEIDLSNATELERGILHDAADHRMIVLDLTEVDYLDSSAVRLIHTLHLQLTSAGRQLQLVAPHGSLAGNVIELTATDKVIPTVEAPPAL